MNKDKNQEKILVSRYEAAGLEFDLGSDFHYPPTDEAVDQLIEKISIQAKTKLLFLPGDILTSAYRGFSINTSSKLNKLMAGLSPNFDLICIVPGNHDQRRENPTNDPWKDFVLPENVKMPYGATPLLFTIGNTKIMAANIGYDFDFINPDLVGVTRQELLAHYADTDDGKYLLQGINTIKHFSAMSKNLKRALTADVDIIVVHYVPHPSLVTFHTSSEWEAAKKSKELGLTFEFNPEENEKEAKRRGITAEQAMARWNRHSVIMGTDVVKLLPRKMEKVTIISGHNHNSIDEVAMLHGKEVRFLSHQMGKAPQQAPKDLPTPFLASKDEDKGIDGTAQKKNLKNLI